MKVCENRVVKTVHSSPLFVVAIGQIGNQYEIEAVGRRGEHAFLEFLPRETKIDGLELEYKRGNEFAKREKKWSSETKISDPTRESVDSTTRPRLG